MFPCFPSACWVSQEADFEINLGEQEMGKEINWAEGKAGLQCSHTVARGPQLTLHGILCWEQPLESSGLE